MRDFYHSTRAAPLDQADGLRRMFAGRQKCFIALAANPFAAFPGAVIERLAAAAATHGRHTLIVDASDRSPAPSEMARVDLPSCVEALTPEMSYLAARGLPLDYVDTRGAATAFLDATVDAAPRADVVLVHANATDLARLFVRRPVRPVIIGADHPDAIKHAYASVKVLAQRASLMTFDLVVAAPPKSPRVGHIANTLRNCADNFVGSLLHDWTVIDPAADPSQPVSPALQRMVDEHLGIDPEITSFGSAALHSVWQTASVYAQ